MAATNTSQTNTNSSLQGTTRAAVSAKLSYISQPQKVNTVGIKYAPDTNARINVSSSAGNSQKQDLSSGGLGNAGKTTAEQQTLKVAEQAPQTAEKTLTVAEVAQTPEDRLLQLKEISNTRDLTPEEAQEKNNIEKNIHNENSDMPKKGNNGLFDIHNANNADDDDTKFEIKEGDIIDWMMKEVILASANYVGGKVCKLGGNLILGSVGAIGNLAKEGYDRLREARKKEKKLPSDKTGNAARNVNDQVKQAAQAAQDAVNSPFPWRNKGNNDWKKKNVQDTFTEYLQAGQLYEVAFRPLVKSTKNIDISSQLDIGQRRAITPEFRDEMIGIMLQTPNRIEGIDEAKLQAIREKLERKEPPVAELSALTNDERQRYDAAVKKALEKEIGNRSIADYAVDKINELKEAQDAYNLRKDEKYYQMVAEGNMAALRDAFGMPQAYTDQMQAGLTDFQRHNPGQPDKKYWQQRSQNMQTQENILHAEREFMASYAGVMLTQKYLNDKNYNPSESDRRIEFEKLTKEGRGIYKLATAQGAGYVEDITNSVINAAKQQEKALKDGKYNEKDKEAEESKDYKKLIRYRDIVKDAAQGERGLYEEAAHQNAPYPQPREGTDPAIYRELGNENLKRKDRVRVAMGTAGRAVKNVAQKAMQGQAAYTGNIYLANNQGSR